MKMFEKMCEALDTILENIDTVLTVPEETVLNESEENEIIDNIERYMEDVDIVMSKWSPEQIAQFNENIDLMLEDSETMQLLTEKNIVRMDRKAVFNQLVGLFSLVIARRRKDPAFALYKKGSALRRKAKNVIKAKYSTKAIPVARSFLRKRSRLR